VIKQLILSLFNISRVNANFLIILLKGSQVFTGLGEFTFLHTLTNVPVHESTFGVKEVELVVKTAPGRGNGGGVGEHAHAARDFRKITARNVCRRFIANTELKPSRTPVNKLDSALGLDDCYSGVNILGNNIATVEEGTSH
jgi:hypothetical protein